MCINLQLKIVKFIIYGCLSDVSLNTTVTRKTSFACIKNKKINIYLCPMCLVITNDIGADSHRW